MIGGQRVDQLDQRIAGRIGQDVAVVLGKGREAQLAQFLAQTSRHQRFFAALQIQAEALIGQVG